MHDLVHLREMVPQGGPAFARIGPMTPRLASVNVATPVVVDWATPLGRTAIMKRSVEGPVEVGELGLAGDQVADTKHHGGVHQAVYAFAREDLDDWGDRLQEYIPSGQFGENLTTADFDVNEALLGERWQIGTVVLQVADVRIPCNVFKNWMRESGFDAKAWVRRFAAEGRPGPYLRVLQPGQLAAGDPIDVVDRPGHGVTVSMMFRAMMTDHDLVARVLDAADYLSPAALRAVKRRRAASA